MRFYLALAATALVACDDIPVEVDCTKQMGTTTGQITAGQAPDIVTADLTVKGVATQSNGLTIRRVTVAGIDAHNDGFNFEQWSAVVPIAVLAGLPADASGANKVMVSVEATDVCDHTSPIGSFEITVDRTPAVRIDRLALAAAFPGEKGPADRFLPADGSAAALVTITANPDAHGASVTVASNIGSFAGVGAGNTVTLAGDGTADATATVFFSATQAGHAIITAGAKSVSATPLPIDVAGPPTLIPSNAQLKPGDSVQVTVLSDEAVKACQATPNAHMKAMSGSSDLMATPAANDTNGDGHVDIVISADATATATDKTVISCSDRYGQFSTGEYDVAP